MGNEERVETLEHYSLTRLEAAWERHADFILFHVYLSSKTKEQKFFRQWLGMNNVLMTEKSKTSVGMSLAEVIAWVEARGAELLPLAKNKGWL